MSSQHLLLPACRQLLLILCLVTIPGCSSDNRVSSPPTESPSPSENAAVSSSSLVVPPTSELAVELWLEAIRRVTGQQSRSIALNQPISNGQLGELSQAGDAVELLLDQGVIDDAGLETIATHLPQLQHLRIRLSPITDQGVTALTRLRQLQVLNLPQSKIGAQGILALNQLASLEHLRLGGAQLDDMALEALSVLPNLQTLHLIGPSITGDGLQSLAKARKLTSLYIDDCPLSDEAWQQLKNARPNLHFHLDQNHPDRVKTK